MEDYYELLIPGLRLWISLGCSVEERTNLQPVDIDIRIHFSKAPLGCHSDRIADAVCYGTLVEKVIAAIRGQSFNLIEAMAARIFETIAAQPNLGGTFVEVLVAKPNHPVPDVQKGMVFKYGRHIPQKSLSEMHSTHKS